MALGSISSLLVCLIFCGPPTGRLTGNKRLADARNDQGSIPEVSQVKGLLVRFWLGPESSFQPFRGLIPLDTGRGSDPT